MLSLEERDLYDYHLQHHRIEIVVDFSLLSCVFSYQKECYIQIGKQELKLRLCLCHQCMQNEPASHLSPAPATLDRVTGTFFGCGGCGPPGMPRATQGGRRVTSWVDHNCPSELSVRANALAVVLMLRLGSSVYPHVWHSRQVTSTTAC